jgi:DNA-binding NarL/FixJ family response regulator
VEVLRLVAQGLPNKAIANSLLITPKTVEHHVQQISNKSGVATRAGATLFAAQHDLVRQDPVRARGYSTSIGRPAVTQ